MGTINLVIKTRKRMNRMIVGLVLLLVAEFFILTPLVGAVSMGVMLATFFGAMWLGNRITNPLLELGEEAVTQALAEESKGSENH